VKVSAALVLSGLDRHVHRWYINSTPCTYAYTEGTVAAAAAAPLHRQATVPPKRWWRVTRPKSVSFAIEKCLLLRLLYTVQQTGNSNLLVCEATDSSRCESWRNFHFSTASMRFTGYCCVLLTCSLATSHCALVQPLEPLQVLTWVIMVAIVAQFYAVIVPALAVSRIAETSSTEH
jgi:hypothetical protein